MTVYTKSVSGSLAFQGNPLFPDTIVFPDTILFPGSAGASILIAMTRVLPASSLSFAGSVSSQRHNVTFAAILRPAAGFAKASSRVLAAAALSFAGSVAGSKSTHVFAKALFASLRAAGSLQSGLVVTNDGGGGFGVPMPDSFFLRYKPTLRRQKVKL